MKEKKDKSISLRLNKKLYQKYVDKAIDKSQKEGRIISVSDVIRKTLEKEV